MRCSNGHEWEAVGDGPAPGDGTVLGCPVCGTPAWSPVGPETPPPAEPWPALPGYEVLGEIGRGGMGVVYKARHLKLNRLTALKVIRKERLAHPDAVRRFRREAQAAARLSHPNIVLVYECDQDGDTHFLAMEYVPGLTLQRLVEQSGPLSVGQACHLMRQAALALQHASEQGLVHRDVKPSNLMVVAPAGKPPPRPVLKVLDLGVARLHHSPSAVEESMTTLTRDGAVIGTPDYVAPEQLENPHGADVRSDLYSLGCTFYFLLSGQTPFPGGTLLQKLDRQRWETPPSVDQLRPDVPPAAAAVVRKLMAKRPDDRYRTAAALAAALEELTRLGDVPRVQQTTPLREVRCFRGHAGSVTAAAFTPDGKEIVSCGADRTLRLWDVVGGESRRLTDSPYEIGCLAVASGRVLTGQGVGVRVWDLAAGKEVQRLQGHTDAVRGIAVASDGRMALTGGDDRTLRLWDLPTGRDTQRLAGHRNRVGCVALSADGLWALSGDRSQSLRLWDLTGGREVRSFAAPTGPVLSVAFAPDGETAVSAHFDTTLRLWEVATGRELRRLVSHKQMVAAVAFAPDGRRIASGGHDHTVRVWDPASGSELWCGQGHMGPVSSVAFSPDGTHLLSAGFDETIRLWKLPE